MANKIYLYQDIYLYPGTYDRYTNLSELYGRSGIYFEAKGEYSSDIGGYEYITKGPYNYTDTMYVPSSYTEMDTTYWVDMELESSMEFSSCYLSGYDKNGNYMASYFYEGTKVSIYCLEEDPSEEPPDLEQLSLVGSYYLSAGETYLYGPTHNDMEEGATYYITFTAEGGVENSFYLKPFVYHEMEGEDYYPGVYPIRFDFGDGYIRCEVSSDYGLVELYKLKSTDPEDPETPSASVTASITLNATTGIATWSYSASSSDISFYEPYVQLWGLNDQIIDPIQIADSSYDFSSYMTSGQTYYATLRVGYYDYNNGVSDEVTARSQEVIYSPSSPDPDEPTEGKTSFNARMGAIASAIRSKCNTSGRMNIVSMIKTLNSFESKNGAVDNTSYVNTDFNSCAVKLANVIRTKGGTNAKLTFATMPAAILALQQAENNPLSLYINIYPEHPLVASDIQININSNAYLYSDAYASVSWYVNGNFDYIATTTNLDGGVIQYNGYASANDSVWATVTVYATVNEVNYSTSQTSDTLIIRGGSENNWDYSEMWYYNNEWYTHNPSEGDTWHPITCSNCNATVYTDSIGNSSYCNNRNTSSGDTCNNYLYWGEDTTQYFCHCYMGSGIYCGKSGSELAGCPDHGFNYWFPYEPGS